MMQVRKMSKVIIGRDKCKGCLLCVGVCPKKILIIDDKLNRRGTKPVAVTDESACIGCGMCYVICPDTAIEVGT